MKFCYEIYVIIISAEEEQRVLRRVALKNITYFRNYFLCAHNYLMKPLNKILLLLTILIIAVILINNNDPQQAKSRVHKHYWRIQNVDSFRAPVADTTSKFQNLTLRL